MGCAPSCLRPGLRVDAQQRHELIAILHQMTAVGDLDLSAIDLLEPGDQRQRHRLGLVRTGAEHEQRDDIVGRRFLALVALRRVVARRLRGAAEQLRNSIRIDDHDHRAVAEDGCAGESREVPQL